MTLIALCLLLSLFCSSTKADDGQRQFLGADSGNGLYRVRMEMSVKGNVNLAQNPLASRDRDLQVPLSSTASFAYDERVHQDADDPAVWAAQRYYQKASVKSSLNKSEQAFSLRPEVSQTIINRASLPEVVYTQEGYFTRDEIDLLRVPVSSMGIDNLLPATAVRQGDTYSLAPESLAAVLNLTAIESADIEANVASLDDNEAKIHLRGNVVGLVDGVTSKLRTVGKLTFNRQLGTCTWLALAIHETREIGVAEPGFDVLATIRLLRKPIADSASLPSRLTAKEISRPVAENRLYVDLESDRVGFSALMDRRWRMMQDVSGAAMMRMVEGDRSIAQCDFRTLPALPEGAQWTLEAFTQDVENTLGNQLGEVIESHQEVSATGLRVLRVAARGAVEDVPIEWVLLHFSDDSGRRMMATFTLEAKQIGRFSGADLQLANSLQWKALPDSSPSEPAGPAAVTGAGAQQAAVRAVQSDENERSTRIASAIPRDSEESEVQSSSDGTY